VTSPDRSGSGRRFGLWLGPALAFATYAALSTSALSHPGRAVAAVAVLMGVLWLTEAVPIPATALLPIALLPLLTGGEIGVRAVAAPYAHDLIFLFMGGFLLALGMERWGLHRRVALHIILAIGDRPATVVLGFMVASAFLSMWISNTATVVMMLPIALSVVELVRRRLEGTDAVGRGEFHFAIALLLGVAYGASIGGTATLIGTPPNLMLAAFVADNLEGEITFGSWLPLGLPFAWGLLPMAWLVLVRVVFPIRVREIPGGRAFIREELRRCGPMLWAERLVLAVFLLAAAAWILRSPLSGVTVGGIQPFAGLTDAGIAMFAALLLFVLPAPGEGGERLLDWEHAVKLPWGVLLLFGGGLSLAEAMQRGGVDSFVGDQIARFEGVPDLGLMALVGGVVLLLTEMTSNTATTATFLPILAASAEGLGVDPIRLVVPAALAASCAFMMPVATPPNAIVFASGELTIRQMCRAGIWLNSIALAWILVLVTLFGDRLPGL
jgi:solute carrier family 13 (sodium-dependent dicarboxylate transporter), member 2/3/5